MKALHASYMVLLRGIHQIQLDQLNCYHSSGTSAM